MTRKQHLYEILRRPPDSVLADLQPAFDALVAAFNALPKAKKKRLRQDARDEVVAGAPEKWQAKLAAAMDSDIATDPEVN